MTFTCKRCGYDCSNRYLLKRHLGRQTSCIATLCDISVEDLIKDLDENVEAKEYKCKYCDKEFTDSSNRYRHQKICKENTVKKEINDLKETISSLQKQMSNIQTTQVTNNINTINNSFNITLNSFGNETYDHITDEFIKKCIMNNVTGVKSLIEKIHFSDDAPENKNVRLRSMKNNLVEVSDNQKWVVKDANEAMEAMINKGCKLLNGYYRNPETGLMDYDINELDTRIQTFLLSVIDKNNKHYFALRRRILALIIEHRC
jgi:hypothetical protein